MSFNRKIKDGEGNEITFTESDSGDLLHVVANRSGGRGLTWPRLRPANAERVVAILAAWIKSKKAAKRPRGSAKT